MSKKSSKSHRFSSKRHHLSSSQSSSQSSCSHHAVIAARSPCASQRFKSWNVITRRYFVTVQTPSPAPSPGVRLPSVDRFFFPLFDRSITTKHRKTTVTVIGIRNYERQDKRNTENHPKNDVINVISEEQLESAEPRSID